MRFQFRPAVFVLLVGLVLAAAGCTTYPGGPGSPSARLDEPSPMFTPPPSWE